MLVDRVTEAKAEAVESSLRIQYDALHSNYLALLQRQASSLMELVQQPQQTSEEPENLSALRNRLVDVLQVASSPETYTPNLVQLDPNLHPPTSPEMSSRCPGHGGRQGRPLCRLG